MTQLRKTWNLINKGLTFVNIFLAGVIFGGSIFQKKDGTTTTVPLWANLLLLAVLITIISLYALRASDLRESLFS